MTLHPVYPSVACFVDHLKASPIAIECCYLAGSRSTHDSDGQSDIDVVVVMKSGTPLRDQLILTDHVATATQAARDELDALGYKPTIFSVPKIAASDEWACKLWFDPEYGFIARGGQTLAGNDGLCSSLPLPDRHLLVQSTSMALVSRTTSFLRELTAARLAGHQACPIRFRNIGYALRWALFRRTGMYLRRFDAVFSMAGHLFGGCLPEFSRQMAGSALHHFVVPWDTALQAGEQCIELCRQLASPPPPGTARLIPPGYAGSAPYLDLSPDRYGTGSERVLRTNVLDGQELVCIIAPPEPGAWSRALEAIHLPHRPSVEPRRVVVLPQALFQYNACQISPLNLHRLLQTSPAHGLAAALSLEPNAYFLEVTAWRVLTYFRFNLLNKWIDLHQTHTAPPAPAAIRSRLEALLGALELLNALENPVADAIEAVKTLLACAGTPNEYARYQSEWLSLAESIPPAPSFLRPQTRARLEKGIPHELLTRS